MNIGIFKFTSENIINWGMNILGLTPKYIEPVTMMAISTGINILGSVFGGRSARRAAARRRKKMTKAIGEKVDFLNAQKPSIINYYDNLDEMLAEDYEVDLGRTIGDFSEGVFAFAGKENKALESTKGLRSGTLEANIETVKESHISDTSNSLDDLYANFEKTGLQLSNARSKELTAIDSAIEDLNIQIAGLG